MQLTLQSDGSEQTVALAELIEIELPERPTTGFRWFLAEGSPFDIVEDVPDVQPSPPGRAGVRRFMLKAMKRGQLELKLVERRRWEQRTTREFVVTIDVT
jgi:predicted secreted protein